MRLWSIHPQYLDKKGIVALWRETLLAKKVLSCKTKGYKNHPQLIRFKEAKNPLKSINYYLSKIYQEAKKRGYDFSKDKIGLGITKEKLLITSGQIEYEIKHLLLKLKKRDYKKYLEIKKIKKIKAHPLFIIRKGQVASWEKIK
jgi:hypothetical protein